jgi:hypothetical protein
VDRVGNGASVLTTDLEIRGSAALSICESLLLCLSDERILTDTEVINVLRDAAEAHAKSEGQYGNPEAHKAISDLITALIDGGNSVRRP